MIKDVTVTIDVQKVIGNIGSGIPLIVYETATTGNQKYQEFKIEANPSFLESETALNDFVSTIKLGENPPEKIACLGVASDTTGTALVTALKAVEEKNYRPLVLLNVDDNTNSKDILDYVNGTDKMLFAPLAVIPASYDVASNENVTAVCGTDTTDVETAFDNIASIWGAVCGLATSSFTYKNMVVEGASVMPNATYSEAVAKDKAIPFIAVLEKAGDNVLSDGKTISGDFIDVIDCKDYIVNQIEYRTQKLLNSQPKIPYTNNGVAMLESVAIDVLKEAYGNGMIADNADGSPAYSVSYALREDSNAEDIQSRKYIGGAFEFVLAGAIHEVKINGTIRYV